MVSFHWSFGDRRRREVFPLRRLGRSCRLAYVPTRRATASDNRKAEAAGSYLSGAVQIDTRAFDAKAISLPCESHSFDSTAPTPDAGRSLFAHEAAMGTHLRAARGVTAGESAMFRQLFAVFDQSIPRGSSPAICNRISARRPGHREPSLGRAAGRILSRQCLRHLRER